jgi:hypothetical protein
MFSIMKFFYIILFVSIGLSSCHNREKDFETAASFAGRVWGNQPALIKLYDADDKNPEGTIEITIQDLSLTKESQSEKDIASIAAMAFLQNTNPAQCEGFKKIKVGFTRNGGAHEFEFLMTDLSEAIDYASLVSDFLNTKYDKNIDGLKYYVDSTMLPDSVLSVYRQALLQGDSLYGASNMHQVLGMRFTKVSSTGEEVIIFRTLSQKDAGEIPLSFYVSRKSGKIISIGND